MKILIVLLRLSGGVGRANTEIANALRNEGHEVDILSREDHLHKCSLLSGIFLLRRRIVSLMKKKRYDVVYTQDYSMALSLLLPFPRFWNKHFCGFCGVKSGKHPELVQWHHRLLQRSVGNLFGRKLVVIGDELKQLFPKSTLIYRGVNLETFKPLGKKRTALGWIEKDIELIHETALKEICKKTNLKLFVAKGIPPEKMNEFYNSCEVFIDLPRTAGFNLSWLEAMAAGVPLIIGNNKGAGTFLPIKKITNQKNQVSEIVTLIKNSSKEKYRDWLIDNKFTWRDKAKELIRFFERHGIKNT